MILVVTEPVTPLAEHLASLELEGPQRTDYVGMGLYYCAKAVSFLNNDCNLVSAMMCWWMQAIDMFSNPQAGLTP